MALTVDQEDPYTRTDLWTPEGTPSDALIQQQQPWERTKTAAIRRVEEPAPAPQPATVANSWTGGAQQSGPPDWYKGYLDKFMASQEEEKAANKARADQLFGMWMQRANQPMVDKNDPNIRAQADANAANEQRAQRNYLADIAESSGPLANLRGEQRMSAERLGQRTGGFEAELIGRQLAQQRAEQADALKSMSGMLSGDQMREGQNRLSLLDQAIKERGLNIQTAGLGQDWQKALLNNQQFMADLGMRAEDRASYWDAMRRGYFS